jgi:hypothetical protein
VLTDITHPRPKDAFDLYRSAAWLAKWEAVMKLKIALREGTVAQLSRRGGAGGTGDVAETGLDLLERPAETAGRPLRADGRPARPWPMAP